MKPRWRLWIGLLLLFGLAFLLLGRSATQGLPPLDDPEPVFAKPAEELAPRYLIDNERSRILKKRNSGQIEWATPLDGYLGRVRPPHLLFDADRLYVTHGDGVTALDAQTGKVLWHSPGPQDRLCLSGNLLLAVRCGASESSEAPWLVARSVKTGEVVFQVARDKLYDPEEVRQLADLFLVQQYEGPGGVGKALLLDPQGNIQQRFNRQVSDGLKVDGDYVFLTSKDVMCRSRIDQPRWAIAFGKAQWIAGGGLLPLADGDLLAFLYGCIADSGVQLIRLRPQAGEQVWQADCDPLGVGHSEYQHQAKVEIVENKYVKVMSKGSSGSFVELLDLGSGRSLSRRQFGGPPRHSWLDRLLGRP